MQEIILKKNLVGISNQYYHLVIFVRTLSLSYQSKLSVRPMKDKPAAQAAGQTIPDATPPVGKIYLFSKIVVTFELIIQLKCPSRFRIFKKNVNKVCFMTGSTIFKCLGVTAR